MFPLKNAAHKGLKYTDNPQAHQSPITCVLWVWCAHLMALYVCHRSYASWIAWLKAQLLLTLQCNISLFNIFSAKPECMMHFLENDTDFMDYDTLWHSSQLSILWVTFRKVIIGAEADHVYDEIRVLNNIDRSRDQVWFNALLFAISYGNCYLYAAVTFRLPGDKRNSYFIVLICCTVHIKHNEVKTFGESKVHHKYS